MAIFNSRPDQTGIFQYGNDEERTFLLQGGILHLTEHEIMDLSFRTSSEEVVLRLGNLGISMIDDSVIEVNIHKSEDPADIKRVYVTTSPNDPMTEVPGSRII